MECLTFTQISEAVTGCDIADALMHSNKPPDCLVSYWFCHGQDDGQLHRVGACGRSLRGANAPSSVRQLHDANKRFDSSWIF